MESLVSSIGLAGIVSFAALVAVMVFGLRSLRVVMATLGAFGALSISTHLGIRSLGLLLSLSLLYLFAGTLLTYRVKQLSAAPPNAPMEEGRSSCVFVKRPRERAPARICGGMSG